MNINRYTHWLKKNGKLVLVATAAFMLLSVIGITRLQINASFDVFMPADSAGSIAIAAMNESFGDASQLLVLAETDDAGERNTTLSEIVDNLASIDGVTGVDAPSLSSSTGENDEKPKSGLFSLPELDLGDLGGTVERDGTTYMVIRLRLDEAAVPQDVVKGVRNLLRTTGTRFILSGETYLQAEIFRYILKIILTIPPLAIILMLTVFRLRIGSMRATMLSMVPAIVGAVITLGGVVWLKGSVSVVSVLVPIFVIVLGSADGLHITSHVIDGLRSGRSNDDAVSATLGSVGTAIILTTVTTMAGFLSLMVINSGAIRELGVTAAIGILIAGIATWLILPTILLHQKPLAAQRKVETSRLFGVVSKLRGVPGIVIPVVIVATLLPGALRLRTNFSMIDMYKERTDVRKSIEAAADLLGGSIPVYLTADLSDLEHDAYDMVVAEAFLEFQRLVEESSVVGRSISVHRIITDTYAGLTGRDAYPAAAIARRMANAASAANPGRLESFIASDGMVRAVFFLRDLDNETIDLFERTAHKTAQLYGIDLTPVGAAFVMKDMNDQITKQQFQSLGLAVLLVFILTAVTQRSFLLGFVSALPVAVTLVAMFGVMGYARIDLSIVTGIMSGLTIGVGIDYAVHFISLYRRQIASEDPAPTASALGYVATPILANALGLAIGFTAMLLSPLKIHETLSILMWVTMMTSSILSLTLLPTITARLDAKGFLRPRNPA